VVGRKNHVEVKGLTGDLDLYSVVEKLEDVSEYPSDRIGVVCQTTTPPSLLLQLWGAIARANPGKQVQLTDTICLPTKARQNAVVALCRTGIDALVVVGGRNSNNSAQLAALAESLGTRAFRVESGADLQPEELSGMETVGLTAGTSALDETVDAVEGALEVLGRDRIMGKAS
jgi:4-hydroxy-3-methylbut-2-enyl diphosphate reductase